MPKAPARKAAATPTTPSNVTPLPRPGKDDDPGPLELEPLTSADEYVNQLWFGGGGTGKTTALAALGNLGPTVIVNVEGGLKRKPLTKRGIDISNINLVTLSKYDEKYKTLDRLYWQLKEQLAANPGSVVGVGFDSITEIVSVLVKESVNHRVDRVRRTGKGGSDDPFFIDVSDYGVMTQQVRELVQQFRDLPCHFGVTALEKRQKDDDGKVAYLPDLTPKLGDSVFGYVDVVCHTQVKEFADGTEYQGQFVPVGKYKSKDRFDAMPAMMVDPWFDRCVAYVHDELASETDPKMVAARARRGKEAEKIEDESGDDEIDETT